MSLLVSLVRSRAGDSEAFHDGDEICPGLSVKDFHLHEQVRKIICIERLVRFRVWSALIINDRLDEILVGSREAVLEVMRLMHHMNLLGFLLFHK